MYLQSNATTTYKDDASLAGRAISHQENIVVVTEVSLLFFKIFLATDIIELIIS
jgi:hypothetical protein